MEAAELLTLIQRFEPKAQLLEKTTHAAVAVPVENLLSVMKNLRDRPEFGFDLLLTHTAVDWLAEGRFELFYLLQSVAKGEQLWISVSIPRARPEAPSVCSIWPIAQWQEREVYDLFGVLYSGHPDLRRLFLEDEWQGFPLRKDYQDDFMREKP